MNCPCCGHALVELDYEGCVIQSCEYCGGEFISPEAMAHIVQTRQERFPDADQVAPPELNPTFGVPETEQRRRLQCPKCASEMAVGNYSGDSGVYIDRCESCGGIWLDNAELERIQILAERWADEAPATLQSIAGQLEQARREAAGSADAAFTGSRFAFVNAIISRILNAA
jgi:Zn-finger nucleic acid-binding protein